ncbi:MAG: NAD(P)H-dependent flavin oxidoreductase [Fusobacteriota bacterium]
MEFPELKIGKLRPKYPIIQGGMAIKVSMAKLAAAVANEGGIGLIAGTALKVEELKEEIKKAKEQTEGIIGVNIMFAATDFMKGIKASIEAGIDVIIYGAGFSKDVFKVAKKADVPVVPIVSSLKLARISERLGAAAVVVEGGNAGGHLGTDEDSWDIVKKIKEKLSIPVIGAGGVVNPEDVKRMFDLGLDGVQMGTRFVATKECNVSEKFKELYVKSESSDVVRIMSSAGLPANAIKSKMTDLVMAGKAPSPRKCTNCLKHCSKEWCVADSLRAGHAGNQDEGIFFTGEDVGKIKEIMSVKEIFKSIIDYKE